MNTAETASLSPDDFTDWYFYPFSETNEYNADNPLYVFVGRYEHDIEVVVYARTPTGGVFHSVNPDYIDNSPIPVSDSFKGALALVLSNPGGDQDITQFLEGMHECEHHFLSVLISSFNNAPDLLPPEVFEFVNSVLNDQLGFELGDNEIKTPFVELAEAEQEQFVKGYLDDLQ